MNGEPILTFRVEGNPLPKQSYRAVKGGGYTEARIKEWQQKVGWQALLAFQGAHLLDFSLEVEITFWRMNLTRADCDNLSKAALDSLNGVVWVDDNLVIDLHLHKRINKKQPGMYMEIYRAVIDY